MHGIYIPSPDPCRTSVYSKLTFLLPRSRRYTTNVQKVQLAVSLLVRLRALLRSHMSKGVPHHTKTAIPPCDVGPLPTEKDFPSLPRDIHSLCLFVWGCHGWPLPSEINTDSSPEIPLQKNLCPVSYCSRVSVFYSPTPRFTVK